MKTPLYREAIAHSWSLAKRHKFLWVYGLFAAILGQMGIVEYLGKVSVATEDLGGYLSSVKVLPGTTVAEATTQITALDTRLLLIWLVLIIIALVVGFLFISVVSQGALIYASAASVKNKRQLPDVGEAWHAGVTHFWRLFIINFFKKAIVIILAIIVSASAFANLDDITLGNSLTFLLTFILASIVGLVLSFLAIYAASYVVVEEYKLGPAIHSAWRMFTDHWLVSVEVGLMVLLFNGVLAILALLGIMVFFFPAVLVWFFAIITANAFLFTLGFIIAIVLFVAYAMLLASVFTVFTTSIWTYLFMKMHKVGVKSRVLHWLTYKPLVGRG